LGIALLQYFLLKRLGVFPGRFSFFSSNGKRKAAASMEGSPDALFAISSRFIANCFVVIEISPLR